MQVKGPDAQFSVASGCVCLRVPKFNHFDFGVTQRGFEQENAGVLKVIWKCYVSYLTEPRGAECRVTCESSVTTIEAEMCFSPH